MPTASVSFDSAPPVPLLSADYGEGDDCDGFARLIVEAANATAALTARTVVIDYGGDSDLLLLADQPEGTVSGTGVAAMIKRPIEQILWTEQRLSLHPGAPDE